MELKYILVWIGTIFALLGINFIDIISKELTGKAKIITTVSLIAVGLVVSIFMAKNEQQEKKDEIQKQFNSALFLSLKELETNKNYLFSLRESLKRKDKIINIGKIRSEKTTILANTHYNNLSKYAYGEQKNFFNLILKLNESCEAFEKVKTYEDIVKWNKSYDLTLDDLYFLNYFLYWYIYSTFEDNKEISKYFSPLNLADEAFTSNEEVKMRYFIYDNEPVTKCTIFLGYID